MATGQGLDYQWFRYTDSGGRTWSMRVDTLWGTQAASGFAAFNGADTVWPKTRRFRPRAVIGIDPVSGRKTEIKVGSATASVYTKGATFTRFVRGLQTAVTFTVSKLVGENQPSSNPKINSFPEYTEPA